MIFALILTPVIVIFAVGGIDTSMLVIRAQNPANLDMLKGLNFVAILSLLGWGTGYFGQPHIWRVSWRRILTAPSAARVASA